MERPENSEDNEWLLECLAVSPRRTTSPEPVTETVWSRRIALADRHGVLPLIYHHLNRVAPGDGVPESVRATLRDAFLMNGVRNRLHYQELALVLLAFTARQIPCVVLKGAHLAALVYATPGLRSMADLDLLVPMADLVRAGDVLRELGFSGEATGESRAAAGAVMHLPRMFKPPGLGIELHHTIARPELPFEVAVEGLWERARPAVIAGVTTRVLSPEDTLLYLCLHTASHAQESQGFDLAPFLLGLKPICDVAATVERYRSEIAWAVLSARAREWRAERCVYVTLWLARDLMGLEIPPAFWTALQPADFSKRWTELAREQVLLLGADLADAEVLRSTFAPLAAWDQRVHTGPGMGKWALFLQVLFPRRPLGEAPRLATSAEASNRGRWQRVRRVVRWAGLVGRMLWYGVRHPRETARYVRHIRKQMRLWSWLKDG